MVSTNQNEGVCGSGKKLPYFSYFKQQLMFSKNTDSNYMLPLFRSLFNL